MVAHLEQDGKLGASGNGSSFGRLLMFGPFKSSTRDERT
jgi:hypothetical protein